MGGCKDFIVGQYVQTIQQDSFMPSLVIGTTHFYHFEGSGPEWYISSMLYSLDIPFWSGTLDFIPFSVALTLGEGHKVKGNKTSFL